LTLNFITVHYQHQPNTAKGLVMNVNIIQGYNSLVRICHYRGKSTIYQN